MRRLLATLLLTAALPAISRADKSFRAWEQRYDPASPVYQAGEAVAFDRSGNVAVTGISFVGSNAAYYTAKYRGPTGELVWEKIYDSGQGEDIPSSVATDSEGNVIVTGYRTNASGDHDYYTIKYASATGTQLWAQPYDGPNAGLDEAVKVLVDSSDNVIVTGVSVGNNGAREDIYTVKYRASDGVVLNQWRYNSPGNRDDRPTDMAIDATDNIAVVGEANSGDEVWFYTGRYNGTGAAGAKIWEKVRDDLPSPSFYGATGVAVDASGNVFTTGRLRRADITFESLTIKYSAANGTTLWDEFSGAVKISGSTTPIDIAVDGEGNALLGGTFDGEEGPSMFVLKYAGSNGAVQWGAQTNPPGGTDILTAIAVDPLNNVILAGTSRNNQEVGASDDYYVAKVRGTDGEALFTDRLNGDNDAGADTVNGLAVDRGGNFAITGESRKATGNTFQMLTVRFGRFLLAVGDDVPGAGVPGSGVPEDATIRSINTPAVADGSGYAARVGIAAGRKRLDAILTQNASGALTAAAVEGQAAPGVTNAKFKSFSDPVVAPNGRLAFAAKLSGVKGSEASGVWTTAFNGTLQLALQRGQQAPGLASGVAIKSVTGVSLRNGHLLSLVKVSGKSAGVSKSNDTVLLGQTSAASATALLRTGQELTVGGETSTVKALTAFTPAIGSGGHGRYHGDTRSVAKVTLADKRTVLLRIDHNATLTPLLFTGQSASGVTPDASWDDLGLPVIGTAGSNYAATGELSGEEIRKGDDSVVVYSSAGSVFAPVAREGDVAPDPNGVKPANGATYSGFFDPIVNDQASAIAFLGALEGAGVKRSNRIGLWFGSVGGTIKRIARLGDSAPGTDGAATDAEFSSFGSIALPSGTGAGPIFLAKVKGRGVNGKNNLGVWGVDRSGSLVQLVRTGDALGEFRITRLAVLQPVPGVHGASRSFNATNSVIVLVTLSDRTEALLHVGIP